MTDSPRYLFKLEIIQSSSMAPNGVRLKPDIKVRPVRKMPLFSRSGPKTPQELVKSMKDALQVLKAEQPGSKKGDKAVDEVARLLLSMKTTLYGTGEQEPQTEIVAQLAQEMYSTEMLFHLVSNLHKLEFEAKKDVAQIFNNVLRRQIGTRSPTVEHIQGSSEILFILVRGYENPEIALNCGAMLRECIRHETLARIILYSPEFYKFFDYVEVSTFDISSDAFATFKDLLTKHKVICAEFLEQNYDKVFTSYQRLLNSENYVTKRQSLKLLGELLLDRHNFTTMNHYISNPDNLKLMMNLLRDPSRNIQFEAFHVFKVFVANPTKAKPILDILLKNKDKLIDFLSKFHTDRTEDEQFNDEKTYLIQQVKQLQPLPNK